MIYNPRTFDPSAPVIVIDIGNSTVKVATWHEDDVKATVSCATEDAAAFEECYNGHVNSGPAGTPVATVIVSVVPSELDRIVAFVADTQDHNALVVGDSLPLPMEVDVRDADAVGADRICAAAAAFEKVQAGCTVVDFGSAVTVDLVDDEGTFTGGAILPGLAMQLESLHEHAALLPKVEVAIPELPYGRDTVEAMQTGVCRGVAGAVRALVEAYASHLNHWSQVIATGGDVTVLSPHCDFIDTAVRDLALRGAGIAYSKFLSAKGA